MCKNGEAILSAWNPVEFELFDPSLGYDCRDDRRRGNTMHDD